MSASKTVGAPVEELFRVVTDAGMRERWLPDGLLAERTARPRRSARFDWGDGTTRVNFGFVDKGTRSQVALAHERLPDQETADKTKRYWRDRLTRLKQLLEG
ncbi:SRPBCC domain-containing protein [Amycolatopsis saalfeldensis]|uniref:SRPBCC domain-containing protein n=1 Tax=Amycolatopsis saalfeldensis TaxID=394193 RepID=UPI001160AD92|nr:SRPBCC domain-containing protein [Amycolatopsis saalfeldensis]